jgi:hypothetical protein
MCGLNIGLRVGTRYEERWKAMNKGFALALVALLCACRDEATDAPIGVPSPAANFDAGEGPGTTAEPPNVDAGIAIDAGVTPAQPVPVWRPVRPDAGPLVTRDVELDWDPAQDCTPAKVTVGASHICAITEGGHLFCWGYNQGYQLGKRGGSSVCDFGEWCDREPQPVAGVDRVVGVSMTGAHTCALRDDGSVWCWGTDQGGLLGTRVEETCFNQHAQTEDQVQVPCTPTPQRVPGVEHAVDIDSWGRTCVAELDGRVKCWGWEGLDVATVIPGVDDATVVEDGCALSSEGAVTCWNGSPPQAWPVNWDGIARDLSKGYNQVCAIDLEDQLSCWGLDALWSDGVQHCQGCTLTPVPLATNMAQVSASLEVTWLRDSGGQVHKLELSQATTTLDLPAPAIDLSAGYYDACAILEDGELYCWSNPAPFIFDFDDGLDLTPEPRRIDLCP